MHKMKKKCEKATDTTVRNMKLEIPKLECESVKTKLDTEKEICHMEGN